MRNCLLDVLGWYNTPDEHIICTESPTTGYYRYSDLRTNVRAITSYLRSRVSGPVFLHESHPGHFVSFVIAGVIEGRDIYLPAHQGWNPEVADNQADLTDALFFGDGYSDRYISIESIKTTYGELDRYPDINPIIDNSRIIFLTSGSTEEPKQIAKSCRQLANEVAVLVDCWGLENSGAEYFRTVGHQHIYGFLFSLCLPMASGSRIHHDKADYSDALKIPSLGKKILVSSPAFLSRLDQSDSTDGLGLIFSSGGPLSSRAAELSESIFKAPVVEVFGSTETGGIAYRRKARDRAWKPFRGVELSSSTEGRLVVVSDFLEDRKPFQTQDLVELDNQGGFVLKGRADSILKISEIRISKAEMASRLMEIPWVQDVQLLPIEGKRRGLGAVIIPSKQRMAEIMQSGRKKSVENLKAHLNGFYPATVIPRKWRFLDELPVTDMGKTIKSCLESLFLPGMEDFSCEICHLSSTSLRCLISFSAGHKYFKGHFPGDPILSGVAQIDTVIRLAKRHLGIEVVRPTIPRIKFSRLVRPSENLVLRISLISGGEVLEFSLETETEQTPVSKGNLKLSSP